MGAGTTIKPAETPMDDPTTDHHDVAQSFDQTAQALEQFLATQAQAGVSELVLVGLLRGYADEIEAHGYIPRSWAASNRPPR
jgi:hypothetical protein